MRRTSLTVVALLTVLLTASGCTVPRHEPVHRAAECHRIGHDGRSD